MYYFVFYFVYKIYIKKLGDKSKYIGAIYASFTVFIHLLLLLMLVKNFIIFQLKLEFISTESSMFRQFYLGLICLPFFLIGIIFFLKEKRVKSIIYKYSLENNFFNWISIIKFLIIIIAPIIIIGIF